MKKKQCNLVSALAIAEYICKEIQSNYRSKEVQDIRKILTSYTILNQAHKRSLDRMNPIEKVLILPNIHYQASYALTVSAKKVVGRIQAYIKWERLVQAGATWDHKGKIRIHQKNKDWSCDRDKHMLFKYDLWSNIHYGFIGKVVGFSEWELLAGAGVAQLKDNDKTTDEWIAQHSQNVEHTPGNFIAAFDDASDNEAIKVGFRLYDRYGVAPSHLTPEIIIEEIYRSYNNNRLLNLEPCPDH